MIKKYKVFSKIILIGLLLVLCGAKSDNVRRPAVSGKFYPSDPAKLRSMVEDYLNKKSTKEPAGRIMGLIAPHAGYVYSGSTAGAGFSAVRQMAFDTVVILGPSHHKMLGKITASDFKTWITPLGNVDVDMGLLRKIEKEMDLDIDDGVFIPEHSLEVELPFLQLALKPGFKIVPLLINRHDPSFIKPEAKRFAELLESSNRKILIVMSTDMSHYYTSSVAEKMDTKISYSIVSMDIGRMAETLDSGRGQLCGSAGVVLGMAVLKNMGADRVVRLKYSHSGMVTGDNSRVVGYGAFGIYRTGKKEKDMALNDEQKKRLLEIARNTIRYYLDKGKPPDIKESDPLLNEERGVFVTLHMGGRLRGCIGNIMPVDKLYLAVRNMAIQSSTRDPRFPPLNKEDIDNIEIEISVLTVPEKVNSPDDIQMGRDGVIVKKGLHQGVFLPQVADETGWSREEFLSNLCYSKAGLSPDAWKDEGTDLYTFQAVVFSEKEMGLK